MTRTSRSSPRPWRLIVAAASATLVAAALPAVAPAAGAEDTAGGEATGDPLVALSEEVSAYAADDYAGDSWDSFASAREKAARAIEQDDTSSAERAEAREALEDTADDLVMVRGLEALVADYETRAPGEYTTRSWAPFAEALTTATKVAADSSATVEEVAAAKTELQTAAGDLEPLQASFETITNDTFWNDTDGNPIYSQGGGVFKFGDTYYWYGVHYTGAEYYRNNPTQKYNNDVTFVSIPVYSSQDLVNWEFENNVATTSTGLYGWVGRLGVVYNENTGKYVLITQLGDAVAFLQGDTPTDDFEHVATQGQIEGNVTEGTGDQTVFTDDDGQDYLIYSNKHGRNHVYVSEIRDSDSLYIEPAVEIGYHSDGREGNAMFKLDGTYHTCASDLHGWNSSVNYCIDSTGGDIQGDYTGWYTMSGTEMDYSHVTQTGFFVTVEGTEQDTVLYAGDRWADFAWNGIGYNQWVPITEEGGELQFHSMSQWQFNAATGEWRVGPDNNYILNPDFQADRISVSNLRGWDNAGGSVGNVEPGANGSRFALQVSNSGSTSQQIDVPAGTYALSADARGSSGGVTVVGSDGTEHVLNAPSSGGWTERQLNDIELPAGTATVWVWASGSGGLQVDDLSLVRTDGDEPEPPDDAVRYEAEEAPAVCGGTIESNHSGYSGSGFCDTPNESGTAAQFTVNADSAGEAEVRIRFANGSSGGARGADVVVNGATVGSASFENTGAWNTWSTKTVTVPLEAGENTIDLVATGSGGLPNVDYLDQVLPDDGNGGDPVRYEVEDAPAACDGTIESDHSGYSGSGFCDTPNTTGTAAQFTVNADSGGEATVEIGFANGSSSGARGADVVVNGSTVTSTSFENTGAWSTWSPKAVTVPLNAGDNTIRLVATGSGGLPNIDYLDA